MMEWLSHYSGYIVLVGFFGAFTGIAVWTFWPGKKETFARHARIPLKEVE